MRKRIAAILIAALVTSTGCMTTGPVAGCYNPRADYEAVRAGITREALDEAIGEVGHPIGDGRTFVYNFEHVSASRSRAWWYAWLGYFSLYTLDPILAVIERVAVYGPAQRTALAVFDGDGRLIVFRQMPEGVDFGVGGEDAPAHGNPGPYSEAWEWETFWGDGRDHCSRGES